MISSFRRVISDPPDRLNTRKGAAVAAAPFLHADLAGTGLNVEADAMRQNRLHAVLFILIASAFVALIKRLTGRERPLQILFVNNGIGLVISTLAVLWVFQPPSALQWVALAGLGATMALAQGAYIQALGRAEASFVVPFSYATLVFAAFYDFLAFDVRPEVLSWVGAGIIIAGGVLLAWRESVNMAASPAAGGRRKQG